jgi:iron complex outermembrane recepter protein
MRRTKVSTDIFHKGIVILLSSGAVLTGNFALSDTTIAADAADAGTPASPARTEDSGLETIIVTATRRAVNLQQVPVTVEALPASSLATFNVTSALDLPNLVPGLSVIPAGGNNLYLRGIGSASTGYNESQVAVYIDGVYLPNAAMSIYSFNNIDQIEVLKGPQGTLYGRNTTGGLIAVTTRDPDLAQEHLDASVGYGNYQTWTADFYGSTPINSTMAANVAIYSSRQNEGWGRNIFTGHDDQLGRETGIESKLMWQPQDGTKITGSFIFDSNNRDYGYAYEVYPGTLANDGTAYLGKYTASDRVDPSAPFTSYIGALKVEQDIGFAAFKSTTAYQTSHQTVLFPGSSPDPGEPLPGEGVVIDSIYETNKTWSQEFQFSSVPTADSRLTWLAGAFIYHDDTEIAISSWTTCVEGVCAPGYTPTDYAGYPTTRSYSGYGDATYSFFDTTHLTLGLRYTDETKGLSGRVTPLAGFPDSLAALPPTAITYPGQPYPGNPAGIPTSLHFDKLTYRAVLAQDFGDNVHAYISDNLGFKSGAYNANLFTNPPVLPEVLYAYEAGIKSEFWDHRIRLNVAYFYYDYTNVQVRSTAPPAPPGNAFLENVASEHIHGFDGDFVIAPIADFNINGGFEIMDDRYYNYPGTTCSIAGTKIEDGETVGAVHSVPCNLAGYRIQYSPPISANIGFTYKVDATFAGLSFNVNDHYSSRYPLAPDNSISEPAKNLVDASVKATAPNKHYDLQLYVRNLTNQYTYVGGLASNSFSVIPGPPRTYGLTFGYHY